MVEHDGFSILTLAVIVGVLFFLFNRLADNKFVDRESIDTSKNSNNDYHNETPIQLSVDGEKKNISLESYGGFSVGASDVEARKLLLSLSEEINGIDNLMAHYITVAMQTAVYRFYLLKMLGFDKASISKTMVGEVNAIKTFTDNNGEELPDWFVINFTKFVDAFFDGIEKDFNVPGSNGTYGYSNLSKIYLIGLEKYCPDFESVNALDKKMIASVVDSVVLSKLESINSIIKRA